MLAIREYQSQTVLNYNDWLDSNEKFGTIILPPGMGKTYILSQCIKLRPKLKYLFLAHTQDIVGQTIETLKQELPKEFSISSEIAKSKGKIDSNVIVASVQTSVKDRQHLKGWVPDVVIIDEFHHYSEDNIQYKNISKRWSKAKILGASATLWRNDEMPIPTGKILCHMDIVTAIEKNYLVEPIFESISAFSMSSIKQMKLTDLLNTKELTDELMCKRIVELVKEGRKGILFGDSTDHAKNLFERLKNVINVRQIYYDTPSSIRSVSMREFKDGKIDCLVNYSVGVEGLNVPHIQFVAINRNIESLSIFQQMAGRGLRTSPNKKDCIILTKQKFNKDDLKSSLDDVSYLNKSVSAFGYSAALPKILNKTVKPILIGVLNKLIKI